MGIIIRNRGFLTTIQDLGRVGYQGFGVPVSGVMDVRSAKIANILVDNPQNEAVIEMLLLGAELEFTKANVIAITGADLTPSINNIPVKNYTAIAVKAGDVLSFGGVKSGSHCYISFAGGLNVPMVMGSKSTYLKAKIGGFMGRRLEKNDEIPFSDPKSLLPNMTARSLTPDIFSHATCELRVILGPQEDHFPSESIETFLRETYTVTNEFDRMGCRLEGKAVKHLGDGNIISDGIAFGAIQIPSHGQPIIMLADRQSVGGYAKIANIISVDLPKLVQRSAGDKVTFKQVTVEQAQELYLAELKELEQIKKNLEGISHRFIAKINGIKYDITVDEA